ncbi:LPS export ABC transporter permease LptF [Sulfitobacter sp. S190]|uniref:LPS export ABC transporter permease LptF n=1 Tax=Sulfitobacter sp. S190 TaxID=2867022 RepID=UPI0021A25FBF|nr:LPS export ABC transporter permease LptF [Sulfitobacter sp. S190]UWR23840.1 LPS export ABC transporter permease LptF [Sulfitobacter sp. S190]
MARFDRYVLSQLLLLFGFFSLVLVAIFWINRAVVLFDRLIGNGQTALVFLEFTALGLPGLITTVLPISAFAAAVYVTNRMSSDSELAVLQSTGTSPWRLARPLALFGLIVALMMSALSHFLVPMAEGQLTEREAEIAQNVSARLLTEGEFLHPTDQVTFYTRAIDEDGILRDVFVSDRRNPSEGVIYTAAEAYLLRDGDSTTLIMVDGLAQRLETTTNKLSTAKFQDFSFDISNLMSEPDATIDNIRHTVTPHLLVGWDEIARGADTSTGAVAEEVHARFAQPLFCLAAAMVGFATLLIGGFSRFGVWREIVIAFGLLLVLDGLRGPLVRLVRDDAALWPVLYLPTLIGLAIAAAMLWQSAHPGWHKRMFRREAAA